MASQTEHQEAIKTAAKIAEAFAGAPGKFEPQDVLESVYRTIIKLIDESRKGQ